MKLLDTDTLSNLVRQRPPTGLLERFLGEPQPLSSTAINLAEIYYGLARRPQLAKVLDTYHELVFPRITILSFDAECAAIAGRVQADLAARRESIGWMDVMIAAIALHHGATLVTGKMEHFSRIPGLSLENWLE